MRYSIVIYLLVALALTACDMAGRDFRGGAATRVQVADMQFTMRANGLRVEAIRTNPMLRPTMERVSLLAGAVMVSLTGCELRQIGGDVAVVHAQLKCRGDADTSAFVTGGAYRCQIGSDTKMRCEGAR